MNTKNKGLLFALLLPLCSLMLLCSYKAYKVYAGVELTIPISGYDPRDLLAGHYLIYRLDFKQSICGSAQSEPDPVFVCVHQNSLESLQVSVVSSLSKWTEQDCTAVIRGQCHGGSFIAGVERFYIPEEHSQLLDRIVRSWGAEHNRAKLVLSVDRRGQAVIKDLLIDNMPWIDFVHNNP